ncbi:MAG: T9SS type A sorting domain-containing protein, partial [Bacteroidota bacterium]
DLSIYPNPAEDQFFLQTGQLTNITGLEVRVMDLNGRVLSNRFIDQLNGRQAMPLGGLPAGIYIIDVVADQGVFRNRLIKQ